MSGETEKDVSGWTTDTLKYYFEALRRADERYQNDMHRADEKFAAERDLRQQQVDAEREKALKIKETADANALDLAREIQSYKDEKANQLREQINSERGMYATKGDLLGAVEKIDATLAPIAKAVTSMQGRGAGMNGLWVLLSGGLLLVLGIVQVVSMFFK